MSRASSGWIAIIAAVAVLVAAGLWSVRTYNRLVRARQAVEAQWAQVESVYQRRVDLVPNLVAATQGFLRQERQIIEDLVAARQAYLAAPARTPERVVTAERLDVTTRRLLAVIERYPELRSREVVLQLMDELAGTENRIAVERRRYNERVRRYNALVMRVPHTFIARLTGFAPMPYFRADADAATAPRVR